jgi:hypothetical protein
MTDAPGETIREFTDARVLDDGASVAFTVEREDGQSLRVSCKIEMLGDIMAYLGKLANEAGEISGAEVPGPRAKRNYLVPILAHGVGFQFDETPETSILVVRCSGFDFPFRVPSNGLARMAADIGRLATTLSASPQKKQ